MHTTRNEYRCGILPIQRVCLRPCCTLLAVEQHFVKIVVVIPHLPQVSIEIENELPERRIIPLDFVFLAEINYGKFVLTTYSQFILLFHFLSFQKMNVQLNYLPFGGNDLTSFSICDNRRSVSCKCSSFFVILSVEVRIPVPVPSP